jgi:hypothetical protein
MSGQRHPDATALAEYQAGLTSGPRGRRLAAHVASCARCASVGDQLAAVSSALATEPAPPMPDAVERRIAAALAAEAEAARTTESPSVTDGTPDTPTPRAAEAPSGAGGPRHASRGRSRSPGSPRHDPAGPGRRGRRSPRAARRFRPAMVLSGAAAAVLIGVAVVLGLVYLPSSSSSSPASGTAASAPSRPSAEAGGNAPASSQLAPGAREPARSEPSAAFVLTTSGTRYQPPTLTAQVRAKMAALSHASGEAVSGRSVSQTLAACVLHLTGNERPSLVDRATYQGKPAYVIAVPDRVWVVGLGCTASNPDLITSARL